MSVITFHHDGGHGWYEVPIDDVYASGADISVYSYKNPVKAMAYLEEDCDMSAFVAAIGGQAALVARYGEIGAVWDGDSSPIRNLPGFHARQPAARRRA